VSPLRGEKPQNWPLSKLNTGRFALRAMLPVKNRDAHKKRTSHKAVESVLQAGRENKVAVLVDKLITYRIEYALLTVYKTGLCTPGCI